jgi:hypothetical protein
LKVPPLVIEVVDETFPPRPKPAETEGITIRKRKKSGINPTPILNGILFIFDLG